jgi:hypothetical protein
MPMQQGRQNVLDSYVTVAERIAAFYQAFPTGRICTQIVEHDTESGFILMRAEIYRSTEDASPSATGHAFEVRGDSYVNRTSYIENAETSAVGRALALLGFEVRRGIASREEMEKAARMNERGGADERGAKSPDGGGKSPAARPETAPPDAPRAAGQKSEAARPDGGKPDAARPAPRPAAEAPAPSTAPTPAPPAAEAPPTSLDEEILRSAQALGYDAAKVRRWVNQKFGVTGGLESLTSHDKREVLQIFREQVSQSPAKPARK